MISQKTKPPLKGSPQLLLDISQDMFRIEAVSILRYSIDLRIFVLQRRFLSEDYNCTYQPVKLYTQVELMLDFFYYSDIEWIENGIMAVLDYQCAYKQIYDFCQQLLVDSQVNNFQYSSISITMIYRLPSILIRKSSTLFLFLFMLSSITCQNETPQFQSTLLSLFYIPQSY